MHQCHKHAELQPTFTPFLRSYLLRLAVAGLLTAVVRLVWHCSANGF